MTDNEQKTKITKRAFNKLIEANFTSGMTMMLMDQLNFLTDSYKMREKQILKNSISQLDKMLKQAKFTEDQQDHLMSISDALHDEVYELKKEYRKQISGHFEIVV